MGNLVISVVLLIVAWLYVKKEMNNKIINRIEDIISAVYYF